MTEKALVVTDFSEKDIQRMIERQKKARREMVDFGSPYHKSAAFLDRWVQTNFKTSGGKVGGWKPFAHGGRVGLGDPRPPGATDFKIVAPWGVLDGWKDSSAKLLQDTGTLRHSFIPFASKKNAGIGSDLIYSKTHDQGRGNIPQRRILPEKKEILPDIMKIFESHVRLSIKEVKK